MDLRRSVRIQEGGPRTAWWDFHLHLANLRMADNCWRVAVPRPLDLRHGERPTGSDWPRGDPKSGGPGGRHRSRPPRWIVQRAAHVREMLPVSIFGADP